MTKFDLELLEEVRRHECENCEHYNHLKDACQFIALKTGKLGLLSHSNGVKNPKARCPYFYKRKWNFIPSFWAWELNRKVMSLLPNEVYEYTKAHYLSSMAIIDRVYTRASKDPEYLPPKRSEIMNAVHDISKAPNEYQHIQWVEVDYLNGTLY